MNSIKRFVALILACAIALGLISCGRNTNKTPQTDTGLDDSSVELKESDKSQQTSDREEDQASYSERLKDHPATEPELFDVTDGNYEGVYISGCRSEDSVVVVPDTIDSKPVVGISSFAFNKLNNTNESKLEAVVLPDSVKEIEDAAFAWNSDLEYIDLGNGLEVIGNMVFGECEKLKTVQFPEGMSTFAGVPFFNCDSLEEVVVPASVAEMPYGIVDANTCPNAVIVTPSGSAVEADCIEYEVPYRNS